MWKLKGINIQAIAEEKQWHRASVIEAIAKDCGLSYSEAEDYTDFLFADHAAVRDMEPEEYLSDVQWEALEAD